MDSILDQRNLLWYSAIPLTFIGVSPKLAVSEQGILERKDAVNKQDNVTKKRFL